MNTSVLFLIFNRPDLAAQSFARIREARPSELFVAADGPRPDRPEEDALCAETRRIIEGVDWPCELHTLFRGENLGCCRAVSEAITWFFEHVEEGIIIEDDCLPDPSYFPFCAELLERYRDDARVMAISGNNFRPTQAAADPSYSFSVYCFIWGWATWRRAWKLYDDKMSGWHVIRETGWLRGLMQRPEIAEHQRSVFDAAYTRNINTWDYYWGYACMRNSGLTILPCVNLVTNIGFDERSTHTVDMDFLQIRAIPICFPLCHAEHVTRCFDADLYSAYHVFKVSRFPRLARIRRRLRKSFPLMSYFVRRIPERLRMLWGKAVGRNGNRYPRTEV
jgi:hypothetical protein